MRQTSICRSSSWKIRICSIYLRVQSSSKLSRKNQRRRRYSKKWHRMSVRMTRQFKPFWISKMMMLWASKSLKRRKSLKLMRVKKAANLKRPKLSNLLKRHNHSQKTHLTPLTPGSWNGANHFFCRTSRSPSSTPTPKRWLTATKWLRWTAPTRRQTKSLTLTRTNWPLTCRSTVSKAYCRLCLRF